MSAVKKNANTESGLSFAERMQQKIQRAQKQGYVAPRRGSTNKEGCVALCAVVHECKSGNVSWTKDGVTESKEKMEYKSALKGIVGLVDKARRAWEKEILEMLTAIQTGNRTAELEDHPFFRVAKAQYDEKRCSIEAGPEEWAKWAAQVRATWEIALEQQSHDNENAASLAEALGIPYVPVSDDTIRFVVSMKDKDEEGGRSHVLPRHDDHQTFLIRENDTDQKIECIGGARTRPFTVIEIGALGYTRVNKGTYAGRFFIRTDNINVDVEDANLDKGSRIQRFYDAQNQRIIPRDDDRFDPRTFLITIDKRHNDPDALPEPTEKAGIFATVFYEGYEKREGEQGGQRVENSPEAFRFRPDDSEDLSITPGLGMQLAVTQWGPAVGDNINEREYFEQLRVSLRFYWQQCVDQPFLQLEQWCAHMMANPIPVLAAWGINGQKTYEKNASLIPGTADGAQVVAMVRDVHWLVPQYILGRCVPVSAKWVRNHFGDEDYLENNETITYRFSDKRTNLVDEVMVTKKFSKNEKESQKEAGEVKLINLSDYTGKLGRFVTKSGTADNGWQFVVAVAEAELDRKTELVMHSELPPELQDANQWPKTAKEGDVLITALEAKPRASNQKLVITVLAHKYTAEDCEVVEPHPVYAVHHVPPSSTHAEPFAEDNGKEKSQKAKQEQKQKTEALSLHSDDMEFDDDDDAALEAVDFDADNQERDEEEEENIPDTTKESKKRKRKVGGDGSAKNKTKKARK